MAEINSYLRVTIATLCLTLVAVLITHLHVLINYSPELRGLVRTRAVLAAAVVTFPLSWFVFWQVMLKWRLAERLRYLVNHDLLTGAVSRAYFFEQFQDAGTPSGVILMADIDHFKSINDRYGHLVGDTVIKAVARAMMAAVGPDGMVCRFGGEEFAVFVPGLRPEQGAATSEMLRKTISDLDVMSLQGPARTTISIGGAVLDERTTLNAALRAADEALYQAKNGGRNLSVMAWDGRIAARSFAS